MAISSNGRFIANAESGISIAELASGQVVRTLSVPTGKVVSNLRFSPTGDRLAVVYDELQVNVYDVGSGSAGPMVALDDKSYVSGLSPDGRILLTSNYMGVNIWDAVTGRPIELEAENKVFSDVAFSGDGRMIATVSQRTVQIWDLQRRRRLASLVHPNNVHRVVFDPTGTYLATGSADNSARVWEIASGRELARMDYDFAVFDLAFEPGGKRLAVGGPNRNLWLELWRPADLLEDVSRRVERNLKRPEWEQYLPELPCSATFPSIGDMCAEP